MSTLKWTDYPKPNLRFIRGIWTVEVNIPASMRHLFGNGHGTTRNRRKSTQTTDKSIAQAKLHELTHQIYSEFDQKQEDHLTRHHDVTDTFATDTIYGLATFFNHKNIPDIKPSTSYSQLYALKTSCDVYAEIVLNTVTDDDLEIMIALLATASPQEALTKFREMQVGSPYSNEQKGLAGRYQTSMIHTYWQDLLLIAARQQGLPEPHTEPFKGADIPMAMIEGTVVIDVPIMRRMTNQPVEPISRPARIVPKGPLMLSDVQEEYFKIVDRDYDRADTRRALKRGIIKFMNLMGYGPVTV